MSNETQSNPSRRYRKTDVPELEIKEIAAGREAVERTETGETEKIQDAEARVFRGRSYTKPLDGVREYYLIVLIVEDGKRTCEYFSPVAGRNIRGFKVKTVFNEKGGIPASHMIRKAEECEVEYGLSFDAGDELYMLCDLDHYRKQLALLNRDKSPAWNLIISNPCIEVWFYYHFESKKPAFPPDCIEKKNSGYMKRMCAQVRKGGIDHTKLLKSVDLEIPIANARNNFAIETNSSFMPDLGSTRMFFLMERLKPLLKGQTGTGL